MRSIIEVAQDIGLTARDLEPYGNYKCKIAANSIKAIFEEKAPQGKLVVVTAITPTKAGEGKTTTCIGLADAFWQIGKSAVCAIRQPSMGPVFGVKGGATGGGCATVQPSEEINLHFTGDMHAVTTANNLLAAIIDNHIYHGNDLGLNLERISFKRVMDMNDRALRKILTYPQGSKHKVERETGFNITAASEVMAILCLSASMQELDERLGRIVVGEDKAGAPVTAAQLGVSGAMALLLKEAIKPNLVQTGEGHPALIHGGPFGNIAHGCSSIMSTKLGLRLADFVITEAGFGADLGFEKYCDIVATTANVDLIPSAVTLVATVRALKLHGGQDADDLARRCDESVKKGLPNLTKHAQIIEQYGLPFVVAINRFADDHDSEIAVIEDHCKANGWQVSVTNVFAKGGAGATDLADKLAKCKPATRFTQTYSENDTISEKLEKLATKIYGAATVEFSQEALRQIEWLDAHGYGRLPVCVAKTQYSLSDNPALLNAPTGFTMHVQQLHLSAGAGFVVALMGKITTMPGLPKHPRAIDMRF